jgi:hypothetical protein
MLNSIKRGFTKLAATAFMAIAAIAASPVFAADVMKGTNQNGYIESVGFDFIASAKHVGGVTSYRTTFSADVYTLSDANASQFNAWTSSIGANAKASSFNGWTYDAAKAKVSCQYSASVVYTPGRVGTETLGDNCQLANSI